MPGVEVLKIIEGRDNAIVQPMLFNIFMFGFRFVITGDGERGYLNDLGLAVPEVIQIENGFAANKSCP